MSLPFLLLWLAASGYLAAAVGFQRNLFQRRHRHWHPWDRLLLASHAVHTLALMVLTFQLGQLPFDTMGGAMSSLAWLIIGLYVILSRRWKVEVVGTVAAPAACVMTAISTLAMYAGGSVPSRGPWFVVHVASLLASYAAFGLAGVCAALWFVQARHLKRKRISGTFQMLPSLDTLDRAAYHLILSGFPLMVLGIASGLVISPGPWKWDITEILVVATFVAYLIYLHLRIAGWQGRSINRILLFAILGLTLTFLIPGQFHHF